MEQGKLPEGFNFELPEGFNFEMFQQRISSEGSVEMRREHDYLREAAAFRQRFYDILSQYTPTRVDGTKQNLAYYDIPSYDQRIVSGLMNSRRVALVSNVGAGNLIKDFGVVPSLHVLTHEYVPTEHGDLLVMQDIYVNGDGRASFSEDFHWAAASVKVRDLRLPFFSADGETVSFSTNFASFPDHFTELTQGCDADHTVFTDEAALSSMHDALTCGNAILSEIAGLEPKIVQ